MIEITSSPIDHAAVTERVRANHAGAVCTFLGTVRDLTGDRKTLALRYEAYPEMALKKLAELERKHARAGRSSSLRWCTASAISGPGEVSVVVAVSTPHRHQAFEACRWLIDTLKEVVPIWKRETWEDGKEEWVHPGLGTQASQARRNRRRDPLRPDIMKPVASASEPIDREGNR